VFCSKCGANIAGDAAFCQTCGTPVTRALIATAAPVMVSPQSVSPHAGAGAIAYVLNAVYAGFWLRLVAFLVDRLILGIASLVVLVPFFFLLGGAAFLDNFPRRAAEGFQQGDWLPLLSVIMMLVGVMAIIQWLYFAFLEGGEKQATWGKQIMGIYVTDLEGNRISFGRASGRFLAKIISGMIPLGIGYIMAGFTERRQALHDMIAGTLVLRR
jgi:uncharacterized RDD family membrane protein YckC